jgi:hypothetical protein
MRPGIACAFVLAVAAPATAATVEPISGQVLINRGSGFEQVGAATEARTGDLVMVRAQGRARIVYGDGCTVEVKPGSVVAVKPEQSCQSRQNGTTGTSAGTEVIAGAAVAASAAAVAVAVGRSGKPKKPISP